MRSSIGSVWFGLTCSHTCFFAHAFYLHSLTSMHFGRIDESWLYLVCVEWWLCTESHFSCAFRMFYSCYDIVMCTNSCDIAFGHIHIIYLKNDPQHFQCATKHDGNKKRPTKCCVRVLLGCKTNCGVKSSHG